MSYAIVDDQPEQLHRSSACPFIRGEPRARSARGSSDQLTGNHSNERAWTECFLDDEDDDDDDDNLVSARCRPLRA
ncbi:hypothetical protein ZHAS_00018331 [Anopheles sinensis]|uniref:Uncharacterized protein n=1 Tax=Anopheles sinensis TaxID=74873 RepID=A0A084WJ60_ANOSI|nr:hypothetical protein ZHAS_00018331 [Anopheles sinensis]